MVSADPSVQNGLARHFRDELAVALSIPSREVYAYLAMGPDEIEAV